MGCVRSFSHCVATLNSKTKVQPLDLGMLSKVIKPWHRWLFARASSVTCVFKFAPGQSDIPKGLHLTLDVILQRLQSFMNAETLLSGTFVVQSLLALRLQEQCLVGVADDGRNDSAMRDEQHCGVLHLGFS